MPSNRKPPAKPLTKLQKAVKAFKQHLPDASPVNLVTDKQGHGRVYVSTYQTMMGLIDAAKDGEKNEPSAPRADAISTLCSCTSYDTTDGPGVTSRMSRRWRRRRPTSSGSLR